MEIKFDDKAIHSKEIETIVNKFLNEVILPRRLKTSRSSSTRTE